MPLPVAHAGHWAFYLLYAVPVLIVLGSIVITMLRQRRERRDGGAARGPDRTAAPKAPPRRGEPLA